MAVINFDMNISETFNFYLKSFKIKKLFKYYPELEDDLNNQYNAIIENKLSSDVNLIEEFYFNVLTGVFNESYTVSWSIPKAKKFIKDNNIKFINLGLNQLFSDEKNLETTKLLYYENKKYDDFEPIIVSYFLPIRRLIVIDGNHRFYMAKSMNRETIKAYVLPPFANSAIMNDRSFKLYTFHHNLLNLSNLCFNPAEWKFTIDKSLKWNSYYGDLKFRKVFINKLRLIMKKPYFLLRK